MCMYLGTEAFHLSTHRKGVTTMGGLWLVLVFVLLSLVGVAVTTIVLTWFYMVKGERPFDAFGHALHTMWK